MNSGTSARIAGRPAVGRLFLELLQEGRRIVRQVVGIDHHTSADSCRTLVRMVRQSFTLAERHHLIDGEWSSRLP
jgi:hypothetical protein